MDISVFLVPSPVWEDQEEVSPSQLGKTVSFYTGDAAQLDNKRIAIVGVREERNAVQNAGTMAGPDAIRKYLYKLFSWDENIGVIDLGNIEPGNEISDTYYALNQTCQFLLKKNIIPLIVGGSQDLTYANYLAYEQMEQTVNVVTIDQRLDFGESSEDLSSFGYLNKIVMHRPNYLFNYGNIGHQRYLVQPDLLKLVDNMYFDAYRLGDMQPVPQKAEPILRNADIVSFDISAIRMSEAPGSGNAGPNGFYGQEAAQLCRYAGMSDKLTSFGIYEFNPAMDREGQTAHLVAQMIWCFIEGVSQRKMDYPIGDYSEYYKYIVPMTESDHEIIFYKSTKTDRWWMDVPYPAGKSRDYERHHLVPCTYEEYQQATNEEMPDRWWRTYQKLV
jgi:arginase family enzyme